MSLLGERFIHAGGLKFLFLPRLQKKTMIGPLFQKIPLTLPQG
jgi:hypothetical protein